MVEDSLVVKLKNAFSTLLAELISAPNYEDKVSQVTIQRCKEVLDEYEAADALDPKVTLSDEQSEGLTDKPLETDESLVDDGDKEVA